MFCISLQIDILVNLLGFSLPIPTCFTEDISAVYVALLGLVPPLLVTLVTIIYVLRYITCIVFLFAAFTCNLLFSARFICVKALSNRKSIHGMVLLSLFVYKYVADTSFILISCRELSYKHNKPIVSLSLTCSC